MSKLVRQIEDLVCNGTDNQVWDDKLFEICMRIEKMREAIPEWDMLSAARRDYLILLAIIGVEVVDNKNLH